MARLIRIEKPESGLDVFLKEISAYLSPQYQLAKRQEERADARLELSERQFAEQIKINELNQRRGEESLQQSKENFKLQNQQYELDKFKSDYTSGKDFMDEILKSYSDSGAMANVNIDSILIGSSDNQKVRDRLKPILVNRVEDAKSKESIASSFIESWNFKHPENPMSISDARQFTQNPKAYSTFLYNNYLKEKPEINPDDVKRLNFFTDRISSKETELLKLQEDIKLLEEGTASYTVKSDRIQILKDEIPKLEKRVNKIVGLDKSIETTMEDGFDGGDNVAGKELSFNLFGTPQTFAPVPFANIIIDDGSYDLAFGSDAETDEVIVDSAIETARKNATGENVESVDLDADFPDEYSVPESTLDTYYTPSSQLADNLTESDLKEMISSSKNKEELNFLQKALKERFGGLSSAYTDPTELRKIETIPDKELFNMFPDNYTDPTELRNIQQPAVTEKRITGDAESLRPATPVASPTEDIEGDVNLEPSPFIEEDFSNLPDASKPTINSLKKMSINDDKGSPLNLENPARFQSQLKGMYNKLFRKGARSYYKNKSYRKEYLRLNRDLIRLIATGSSIGSSSDRMSKIIPREIEMFLKSKKLTPESAIKRLQENIKWSN